MIGSAMYNERSESTLKSANVMERGVTDCAIALILKAAKAIKKNFFISFVF
jgi:hypothetical protein